MYRVACSGKFLEVLVCTDATLLRQRSTASVQMGTLWFAHCLCHFGPNVRMSELGRRSTGGWADFGLEASCEGDEKTMGPCFAGRARARSAVRL